MRIDLVDVVTADGVRLDGALREPPRRTESPFGVNIVICHHGQGGRFYGPSFYNAIGDALLEAGCAVLRVNNRGHDQMYATPTGRLGSIYENVDDCRLDLRAWSDFAAASGYGRIGLWGHSLGAVKTIYSQALEPDPRVAWAIASSPPRFSYEGFLASQRGAAFSEDFERARQLMAEGNPEALIAARVPLPTYFAARVYVDKYGPPSRYDFVRHLTNIRIPLLITVGGDEGGVDFEHLMAHGPNLQQQYPNLRYRVVAGADHLYNDRAIELWQAARDWIRTAAALGIAA